VAETTAIAAVVNESVETAAGNEANAQETTSTAAPTESISIMGITPTIPATATAPIAHETLEKDSTSAAGTGSHTQTDLSLTSPVSTLTSTPSLPATATETTASTTTAEATSTAKTESAALQVGDESPATAPPTAQDLLNRNVLLLNQAEAASTADSQVSAEERERHVTACQADTAAVPFLRIQFAVEDSVVGKYRGQKGSMVVRLNAVSLNANYSVHSNTMSSSQLRSGMAGATVTVQGHVIGAQQVLSEVQIIASSLKGKHSTPNPVRIAISNLAPTTIEQLVSTHKDNLENHSLAHRFLSLRLSSLQDVFDLLRDVSIAHASAPGTSLKQSRQ